MTHHTVQVDTPEPVARWRELGSADDVGVLTGDLRVGPTRRVLDEVYRQTKGIPRPAEDAVPSDARATTSFSLSANMLVRRSYNRVDLEDTVGRGLAEARAPYTLRAADTSVPQRRR